MKGQYQQGDVIFKEVKRIPEGAKRVSGDKIILAKGETTGHAHVITDTKSAISYELKGELYLEVLAPVIPQHEEHKNKPWETLPLGKYKIDQVRELDWFEGMERKVVD